MRPFVIALTTIAATALVEAAEGERIDIALPTDNDALYSGDGPAFYQYIERDFNGAKSTPWEGGQYGFVRDPKETSAGLVYTRFHEGVDIKPVHRDANDEPLDEVRSIGDGKVVHTNSVAGYSNYGRYVVVEHHWGGCDYYSLYGHLNSIAVKPGQPVRKGERLGIMGYTGVGIDKPRAHVHLELNLLLSSHFEAWHNTFIKNDPNHNGMYNGLNLAGLDIARFFLELQKNPDLTVPQFFKEETVAYKVALPKTSNFELVKRYPWMLQGRAGLGSASWEVSFARTGLPLAIEPGNKKVRTPELIYVKKTSFPFSMYFRGEIGGPQNHAQLTTYGFSMMRMLTFPD